MSKTTGRTRASPVNGTTEMPTLIPPLDGNAARSCNWYCHRLSGPGCQHGPPEQATGAGGAATASVVEQSARASPSRGIDRPGLVIILHLPSLRTVRPLRFDGQGSLTRDSVLYGPRDNFDAGSSHVIPALISSSS